jgi:hypothetical protein
MVALCVRSRVEWGLPETDAVAIGEWRYSAGWSYFLRLRHANVDDATAR